MVAAQPAARDSMRENHAATAVERVPGATRIMGVDPGLTRCGFSMLDMTADRKAHFVNVGVACTIPAYSLDFQRRLPLARHLQAGCPGD